MIKEKRGTMELEIAGIVDAFRNRAAEHAASGAGGLSFSQQQQPAHQPVSLSQSALRASAGAWLLEVNDVLAQVAGDKLHCLVQEAKEADLLDLLKALQHACAAGTERGNSLCLSLAKVTPTSTGMCAEPGGACPAIVQHPVLTMMRWMSRCASGSPPPLRDVEVVRSTTSSRIR